MFEVARQKETERWSFTSDKALRAIEYYYMFPNDIKQTFQITWNHLISGQSFFSMPFATKIEYVDGWVKNNCLEVGVRKRKPKLLIINQHIKLWTFHQEWNVFWAWPMHLQKYFIVSLTHALAQILHWQARTDIAVMLTVPHTVLHTCTTVRLQYFLITLNLRRCSDKRRLCFSHYRLFGPTASLQLTLQK